MVPFSETVWLWRRHRGLTQAALARRARIPRPNLSAIERGKREVSLPTLRALAAALNIRPGRLADGLPPSVVEGRPSRVTREAMERIAAAVISRKPLPDRGERRMAEALQRIASHRLMLSPHARRVLAPKRAAQLAWVWLKATYSDAVVRSLLQRLADHQRRHDAKTN